MIYLYMTEENQINHVDKWEVGKRTFNWTAMILIHISGKDFLELEHSTHD